MAIWGGKDKRHEAMGFGKQSKSQSSFGPSCFESHPVLKLGKGELRGGRSSSPIVKDYDIYVSLQSGTGYGQSKADPWEAGDLVFVRFDIDDMCPPDNVDRFLKMVTWLCNQLQAGKRVHIGCIGGHGRTGMVISAIVAEINGEKDAIQWVREHYCHKAVESDTQVKFLMKHYGVSKVKGTKGSGEFVKHLSSKDSSWLSKDAGFFDKTPKLTKGSKVVKRDLITEVAEQVYGPMSSPRNIWKAWKTEC